MSEGAWLSPQPYEEANGEWFGGVADGSQERRSPHPDRKSTTPSTATCSTRGTRSPDAGDSISTAYICRGSVHSGVSSYATDTTTYALIITEGGCKELRRGRLGKTPGRAPRNSRHLSSLPRDILTMQYTYTPPCL